MNKTDGYCNLSEHPGVEELYPPLTCHKLATKPHVIFFLTGMSISRFHEGLLTLKSFPNVLVGFQEFWSETFCMLCSHDRFI